MLKLGSLLAALQPDQSSRLVDERVSTVRLVPGGVSPIQDKVDQGTVWPASMAQPRKAPVGLRY
jgi:hypothetical protein